MVTSTGLAPLLVNVNWACAGAGGGDGAGDGAGAGGAATGEGVEGDESYPQAAHISAATTTAERRFAPGKRGRATRLAPSGITRTNPSCFDVPTMVVVRL